MTTATSKLEAVRQAKAQLGEVPAPEMAAYIQATFGLELKPTIVNILLGTLREREFLEASKRKAFESVGQADTAPSA